MKLKEKKQMILMLLRDDIVNTKLVDSLCDLGFHAEVYYLNTSSVVFKLLEIDIDNPKNEQIYKEYIELRSKSIYAHTYKKQCSFDNIAMDLYKLLISKKRNFTKVVN